MYVLEGDRPSKNQLKMRRASRRMSIFTADLRQDYVANLPVFEVNFGIKFSSMNKSFEEKVVAGV